MNPSSTHITPVPPPNNVERSNKEVENMNPILALYRGKGAINHLNTFFNDCSYQIPGFTKAILFPALLGFGLDALIPLSIYRVFLPLDGFGALLLLCPAASVPPIKKNETCQINSVNDHTNSVKGYKKNMNFLRYHYITWSKLFTNGQYIFHNKWKGSPFCFKLVTLSV